MARVFTPALSDFSTGLVGALDEHAAEVSGSRPPALNLKERGQARQAFMGSIIGLNDGSVQIWSPSRVVSSSNRVDSLSGYPVENIWVY